MTSRDRWTVYPLVFLALGLAVRALVVPTGEFITATVDDLETVRLTTQEIVVVGPEGEVLVHIGREAAADDNAATAGGGRIELHDKDGVLIAWLGGEAEDGVAADESSTRTEPLAGEPPEGEAEDPEAAAAEDAEGTSSTTAESFDL